MLLEALTCRNDPRAPASVMVFVRLTAPQGTAGSDAEAPPVHLALALDVSSSMGGPSLATAIDAVRSICGSLRPCNQFALVTFSRDTRTVFPLAEMSAAGQARLAQALESVQIGIGTNLEAGYRAAAAQLTGPADTNVRRRILLVTDGFPSVGADTAEPLMTVADEMRARSVVTSTAGIGVGHHEALLQGISEAGDGAYHYVAAPADIAGVMATELADARALHAGQTVVEVHPGPGVKRLELLHRFPSENTRQGLVVQVGGVGHVRARHLLFGVVTSGDRVGTLKASWREVATQEERTVEADLVVQATHPIELERRGRRECRLVTVALSERRAWRRALRGDYDGAHLMLRRALDEVAVMDHEGLDAPEQIAGHRARLGTLHEVIAGHTPSRKPYLQSVAYTTGIWRSHVAGGKAGRWDPTKARVSSATLVPADEWPNPLLSSSGDAP